MRIDEVSESEVPILREMVKRWLEENGALIKYILSYEKEGIYKDNRQAQELLHGLEICKAIEYACKLAIDNR